MSKYHNKKVVFCGIKFDSKAEANRYAELLLLLRAGQINNLERQVEFTLIPAQRDGTGRTIEQAVRYKADFVYTEKGHQVVEDVKSKATITPEYIIKRKLMLFRFGIRIREVEG